MHSRDSGIVTISQIGTLAYQSWAPRLLFHRPLLLFWEKWFIKLSIDKKVTQHSAMAPSDAVCPPLDSRRILFVDKDTPASDQIAPFSVVRSPWYM